MDEDRSPCSSTCLSSKLLDKSPVLLDGGGVIL